MSWEERGGAAAGVPGWARGEARLALRAMSAAHCPGVKVPFHSAPAPVDGITPSRSSPSRYVPRSEDGARSKLRLLSYLCAKTVTQAARFFRSPVRLRLRASATGRYSRVFVLPQKIISVREERV